MNTPKIAMTTNEASKNLNVVRFNMFSHGREMSSSMSEGGSASVIRFPTKITSAPYIPVDETPRRHQANVSLYKECFSQIISDPSIKLHILPMPQMAGQTITYTIDEEIDLAQSLANLMDTTIGTDDMIVAAGYELLDGDFTEDEMLEIVLTDLALHLDKLFPVADRTAGKMGRHMGWASVASVICGAHDVLHMLDGDIRLSDRIKGAALKSIEDENRFAGTSAALVNRQNRGYAEAVERVCAKASETCGDYICLPTTGAAIAAAAKNLYLGVADRLPVSLKLVV